MIYLRRFTIPSRSREEARLYCNAYPFGVFPRIGLHTIECVEVTVFCGGNGTGKTTLLNVIAETLRLPRLGLFNTSEAFGSYVYMCDAEVYRDRIPPDSAMFTSDDVFAEIISRRETNREIGEKRAAVTEEYAREMAADQAGDLVQFRSMADYDALERRVRARRKSRSQYVEEGGGTYHPVDSNGQHALAFYKAHFLENALYLLDEPENSLSPVYQAELAGWITDCARFFGCQFVIATHSPFFISLPHAAVYDFDTYPVEVRPWWENRNMQTYYALFRDNRGLFEGTKE